MCDYSAILLCVWSYKNERSREGIFVILMVICMIYMYMATILIAVLLDKVYHAQVDGTFRGKHKGRKIECGEGGKLLAVGSLAAYQARQHDIYQLFVLEDGEEDTPPLPRSWDATFCPNEGCYYYPVPDCPQGREGHGVRYSCKLRWHFSYQHSEDRVAVGGVWLQKCRLCGLQVSTVGTHAHEASKTCQ